MIRVLGLDIAASRWESNGTGLLGIFPGENRIAECRAGALDWPRDADLTPELLAQTVEAFILHHGIAALSVDGPQGWRDPNAGTRRGVGRLAESFIGTPGKTGEFGRVYPRTYTTWVRFSIRFFDLLLAGGRAILANDPNRPRLPAPPEGSYYLLECFPTCTWRASRLTPLPGHRNAPPPVVEAFAHTLAERFHLPDGSITDDHDDLQGIVAALPAAALLGGPVAAAGNGCPAFDVEATGETPAHRAEGLIWCARPDFSPRADRKDEET